MRSIDALFPVRKEKQAAAADQPAPFALCRNLRTVATAAVFAVFFCLPLWADPAKSQDLSTDRRGYIGKDQDTGDRIMNTPPPVEQPQNQGPQTIIVAPEVDMRRPGYGPTPPRPYPPGPRPYGPSSPGAPYPGPRPGGGR